MLGLWVGRNEQAFELEVSTLTTLLRDYAKLFARGVVEGVVVGSETLYRRDQSLDQLVDKMNRVRSILRSFGRDSIPVFTSDVFTAFTSELINAVDVIFPTIHPFFSGQPVRNAMKTTEVWIKDIIDKIPNGRSKPLLISEIGWWVDSCLSYPDISLTNKF